MGKGSLQKLNASERSSAPSSFDTLKSFLQNHEWKVLFSSSYFSRLPRKTRRELSELLPDCDQATGGSLPSSVFTNEYFSQFLDEYKSLLMGGGSDHPDVKQLKQALEIVESCTIEPWMKSQLQILHNLVGSLQCSPSGDSPSSSKEQTPDSKFDLKNSFKGNMLIQRRRRLLDGKQFCSSNLEDALNGSASSDGGDSERGAAPSHPKLPKLAINCRTKQKRVILPDCVAGSGARRPDAVISALADVVSVASVSRSESPRSTTSSAGSREDRLLPLKEPFRTKSGRSVRPPRTNSPSFYDLGAPSRPSPSRSSAAVDPKPSQSEPYCQMTLSVEDLPPTRNSFSDYSGTKVSPSDRLIPMMPIMAVKADPPAYGPRAPHRPLNGFTFVGRQSMPNSRWMRPPAPVRLPPPGGAWMPPQHHFQQSGFNGSGLRPRPPAPSGIRPTGVRFASGRTVMPPARTFPRPNQVRLPQPRAAAAPPRPMYANRFPLARTAVRPPIRRPMINGGSSAVSTRSIPGIPQIQSVSSRAPGYARTAGVPGPPPLQRCPVGGTATIGNLQPIDFSSFGFLAPLPAQPRAPPPPRLTRKPAGDCSNAVIGASVVQRFSSPT